MYEAFMAGSGKAKKADVARWVRNMRRMADVETRQTHSPKTAEEWSALGMRVHDERDKIGGGGKKGKKAKAKSKAKSKGKGVK